MYWYFPQHFANGINEAKDINFDKYVFLVIANPNLRLVVAISYAYYLTIVI